MDRDFDEWLTGIRRYRDHGQTVFGRQGPRVDAIPNLFDACDRTLFEEREDQVGRERGLGRGVGSRRSGARSRSGSVGSPSS